LGTFRVREKEVVLKTPIGDLRTVVALVPEEKGSDVNLAAHLVADAAQNRFDIAFVLSNDSDLSEALRLTREDFQKSLIVFNPDSSRASVLEAYASEVRQIRPRLLEKCLLPTSITATDGKTIHKPPSW
jgi:uncharacterized LabA/DUF88 family protein